MPHGQVSKRPAGWYSLSFLGYGGLSVYIAYAFSLDMIAWSVWVDLVTLAHLTPLSTYTSVGKHCPRVAGGLFSFLLICNNT